MCGLNNCIEINLWEILCEEWICVLLVYGACDRLNRSNVKYFSTALTIQEAANSSKRFPY